MARHGLVDAQDLDLVFGPDFGLVEVDVVIARTAAVGGRAIVIGGGRIGRDIVGYRPKAVWHAR